MSGKKKGGRGSRRAAKYNDDPISDDDDTPSFDVAEKLRSKDFPRFFIREITGTEVNSKYILLAFKKFVIRV